MAKQKFKHTERTMEVYNSMIKEYREIICDSDPEKGKVDDERNAQ